jgi:ABC-type uncharacterized transport system fused permease/ATPase subunit
MNTALIDRANPDCYNGSISKERRGMNEKMIVSRILCQNTYSFFSPFLIPLIPHVEEFLLRRRKFGKVFSAYCSFRSMQTR